LNTASGQTTLFRNTTGNYNTASGARGLYSNTTGSFNTSTGVYALYGNTAGAFNTAIGAGTLLANTADQNTATGAGALVSNTTGSNNIALGNSAGSSLTTGSNNITIGNTGVAAESNTIRIGVQGTQSATYIAGIRAITVPGGLGVFVDANGRLGTATSSERFKEKIKAMDKASEAILALKPVTFRYKHELDPEGIAQFGLVAEEVERVNSDLVARDEQGKPFTVRYDAVNAMLLNEFLKEHRKNEQQQAIIMQLKSTDAKQEAIIVQQQKQIEALTAGLQKVSAQLELRKPAPQTVLNSQ